MKINFIDIRLRILTQGLDAYECWIRCIAVQTQFERWIATCGVLDQVSTQTEEFE